MIGEWKNASTVEEVNANNMNNRISSRNIFGLAGSVIGDQALAMLQASEEKRVASGDVAAAKKILAKEKKTRDTTARRLRDPEKTRATRPFRAAPSKD